MIPRYEKNVVWREVHGKIVAVHTQRGEVHDLDLVGSFIWQQTDGIKTTQEIVATVLKRFDVEQVESHELVQQEVLAFFEQMNSKGLISLQRPLA